MKKTKRIFLLVVLLILGFMLSASSFSWIGFSSGAEFGFNQTELNYDNLNIGGSTLGVPLTFEGRNYFLFNSSFGLGYGFTVYIPLESNMGDYGLSSLSTGIRPSLGLFYRKEFNKTVDLELGLGYLFEYRSCQVTEDGVSYGRITTLTHSIYLDAEFGFNITSYLSLYIGSKFSTPVYIDKTIEKGEFSSYSGHYKQYGINITPSVIISKTY